ncbi:unnamed protein product [Acidithrix sp. C25]|nr:unnamed protein product [Acidithrix sp. C25]
MTQAENRPKSPQKGPIRAIFREICERWVGIRLHRVRSKFSPCMVGILFE